VVDHDEFDSYGLFKNYLKLLLFKRKEASSFFVQEYSGDLSLFIQ